MKIFFCISAFFYSTWTIAMPQDAEVEHTALNQYKVFRFFKATLTDEHLKDIFQKYDPRKIKILQISDSKTTPQLRANFL
jgi:hypothetical protein